MTWIAYSPCLLSAPTHDQGILTYYRTVLQTYIHTPDFVFPHITVVLVSQVVAQALGLALAIGFVVATGVQLAGPRVLVRLAGEKSKEVRKRTRACWQHVCWLFISQEIARNAAEIVQTVLTEVGR